MALTCTAVGIEVQPVAWVLEFEELFFFFSIQEILPFPFQVTENFLFLHVFLIADVWSSLQLLLCFPCLQILK